MSKQLFRPLYFLAILFFCQISDAQVDTSLINSGDLLDQGSKLHDNGNYKDAIALYKKISRSDTNYSRALHELSLSSYSDSEFIAARDYADLGLKLFPETKEEWLMLKADALDEMNQKPVALECYDTIIKDDPNSYLGWLNKGITLFNLERYPEAKICFQRTLTIYPFYASAHYFLGRIYLIEGNLPASIMAFAANLAVSPENKYKGKAVGFLTSIANVKDDVAQFAENAKPSKVDNFDVQQEIILSKISLDKQYKLQTDVEDPITRQMQVLFEKMDYNKSDTGFCMQFYEPFFKKLFQDGQYNTLVNYMFSGLDIKSIKEFVKKHKRETDSYIQFAADYLNSIKETQLLNADARAVTTVHYLFNNGNVSGIGNWKDAANGKSLFGPWKFYYNYGELRSQGAFNDNDNKEGEWYFYYRNGQLRDHSFYSSDSLNGPHTAWFSNGNISEEGNYKNGQPEGEYKTYYYNGLVRKVAIYVDGKKTGIEKGYKSTGELSYEASFKNDVQDGPETYYYANGKILSQATYVNGKADGPYKKFNEDGVVIMQGAYQQDKPMGKWQTFYSSSKLKEEYNYLDNGLEGEYKEYYESGKLHEHLPYVAGKEEGKAELFDEDGKIISESGYEKGRLRELKFYDRTGNVVSNTTTRNGAGTLVFYNAWGAKTSEGNYTKDGLLEGKSTTYYEDGSINGTATYSKGLLNGEKLIYFRKGALNSRLFYTDDKSDGYYTEFFENSKPKYTGWFVDGDKQGIHNEYDPLGNLRTAAYYKNGEQDGYTEYYFPDGKKDYEALYVEGWIKHVTQFDTTGRVISDFDIPKGNTDFAFNHFNGKPSIRASYRHYYLDGRYDGLFFNGTIYYTMFYKNGSRDSVYKGYFYGGQLETEGRYLENEKTGVWKTNYENGKVSYTESYKNGDLDGVSIFYNEDGTKRKEISYKTGELDGPTIVYGDNNLMAFQINYHQDRLISYTYDGKDGKLVPPIYFKNETGPITAYYSNGTKSAEMNYVAGTIEGVRKLYYSNGKTYTEGERVSGDYEGPQKKYSINGQLLEDENYYNDNLHGAVKYYYANGKTRAEETYYYGQLNGVCRYYDETGKLKQTRYYYYGSLLNAQ